MSDHWGRGVQTLRFISIAPLARHISPLPIPLAAQLNEEHRSRRRQTVVSGGTAKRLVPCSGERSREPRLFARPRRLTTIRSKRIVQP